MHAVRSEVAALTVLTRESGAVGGVDAGLR